jgi:hypothetical protein
LDVLGTISSRGNSSASLLFGDRSTFTNTWQWYSAGNTARLFRNFNTPADVITVDQNGNTTISGSLSALDLTLTSDARAKTNIRTLASEASLEKVCRLRPVSFDWKHNGHPDEGVIAQEIREIFPEFVVEASDGRLSVKYPSLIAPLTASVQELNKRNGELSEQVKDLQDENARLKEQMNGVLQRLESLEKKAK